VGMCRSVQSVEGLNVERPSSAVQRIAETDDSLGMKQKADLSVIAPSGLVAACVAILCLGLSFAGVARAATTHSHRAKVTHPRVASSTGVDAWPFKTLQIGVRSDLGSAITPQEKGTIGLRYMYLAGGVNTGQGWAQYANGIPQYIADSEADGITSVFTYNQLQQSLPGNHNPVECSADLANLQNKATMLAYYQDLKLFFQKAASATRPVILQDEPDLWGCLEQAAGGDPSQVPIPYHNPNAATVPAEVAASGMPGLSSLPNTAAGFAQAIITLRNDYAPKVLVGYHDSTWGTGIDLQLNHPNSATVTAMAATSVAFYRSLGAHFNAVFSETHDRDAGYRQAVDHETTSYLWTPTDFHHLGSYLGAMHQALGLPVVIWQIPTGTTGMNNTTGNYADNQVQTLLSNTRASRALLKSYAADGISALLFGTSIPGDTPITSTLLSDIGTYYSVGAIPVS
jgi:hypothetical protein